MEVMDELHRRTMRESVAKEIRPVTHEWEHAERLRIVTARGLVDDRVVIH
jgi:hypothetical protein